MPKADNIPPSCAVVTKSGNINFLEPSWPFRACNGTVLPLLDIIMITGNCIDVDGNKSTLLLLLLLLSSSSLLSSSYLCGIIQLRIYSLSFGDHFFKFQPLLSLNNLKQPYALVLVFWPLLLRLASIRRLPFEQYKTSNTTCLLRERIPGTSP